jgi:hypothetical protein
MISALEAARIRIREELNLLTDQVINGVCQDYPAYRHACGQALGLVAAEEILKDIEGKLNSDEDGEDEEPGSQV